MKTFFALTIAVLLAACTFDFHDEAGRVVTSDVNLEVGE